MKISKLAAFGVASIALASAGCVSNTKAPADMKMTASDQTMLGSCMSMSRDDMMKSTSCKGMMTKMNMTQADMQTMMACHKMPQDVMMKDMDCVSMKKMHPDMMKMEMPK